MPYDFETLYRKGKVGRERERDNFETESRAGKFIHKKTEK